jgi:hypothetical protein
MARMEYSSSETEPYFPPPEHLTRYLLEAVISTKAEIAALRALMTKHKIALDDQEYQTALLDARIYELEQLSKEDSYLGQWARYLLGQLKQK